MKEFLVRSLIIFLTISSLTNEGYTDTALPKKNTGELLHILEGHTDFINLITISDVKIISGSGDTIRIWELKSSYTWDNEGLEKARDELYLLSS